MIFGISNRLGLFYRQLSTNAIRGAYHKLDNADLKHFESIIGRERCITNEDSLANFNVDWTKKYRGNSKLVLLPSNAQELAEILRHCNKRRLAVTPQGGNTGLVGGSVPVYDEIIISSNKMNKLHKIDTESSILSCQSGCILQNLDDNLSNYGLMMPLDLGSKGSCQIGGNIATNAGGIRMLRYGSIKGRVLGLEVVLADGTIIDTLNTAMVRKDNTGYDLKQIFIGSEGTLGFITGAAIWCAQKPQAINTTLIACAQNKFQCVIEVFKHAKKNLNEILSAFEFMDKESLQCVTQNLDLKNPFDNNTIRDCEFYCLVETHGSNDDHDKAKLEAFFDTLTENNLCKNALLSESISQAKSIWDLRENIGRGLKRDGYVYKYDLSLPLNATYSLIDSLRDRLPRYNNFVRCVGYGHAGDGNLHLNITSTKSNHELHHFLENFIMDWVKRHNGSFSAEHGIGLAKTKYMKQFKSNTNLQMMTQFKKLLDSNLILNPYKTIVQ